MRLLNCAKLNEAMLLLPLRLKNLFFSLNDETKDSIREIRLRNNKPIVVVTAKGSSFLGVNSKLTYILSDALPTVTQEELSEVIKRACNYSVYSYQQDLNNGYITVKGGCRIGVCSTAVIEDGRLISVRDISSINIRISGEYYGCADDAIKNIFSNRACNVIVAGKPMCGKTTFIRDLVRQLSNGNTGKYYKCVVCDERNEISAISEGRCGLDVGVNTDILSGFSKKTSIEMAVRTLSPEIVFCDEVSSTDEAEQIINGIMCGCSFVVSAHLNSEKELYSRQVTRLLTDSGLFDYVLFLGNNENVGKIVKTVRLKVDNNEDGRFVGIGPERNYDGKLLRQVN